MPKPPSRPFPQDWFESEGVIAVHAYPKSRENRIDGMVESAAGKRWLKVRVTAPAEDGKANAALCRFLAKTLNLSPSSLSVISGETSRYKRIRIHVG